MLFDAGETNNIVFEKRVPPLKAAPRRPDYSRRAGEWYSDYIRSVIAPHYYYRNYGNSKIELEYYSLEEIPIFFGTGNRLKDKETYWSTGFTSQQDQFAISFSNDEVLLKINDLKNSHSQKELSKKSRLCTTNQWHYQTAKSFVSQTKIDDLITKVNYRPFDHRYTIFRKEIVTILRKKVQSNFYSLNNIGLISSRAVNDKNYAHVFCSMLPTDKIFISSKTSTNAYIFHSFYLRETLPTVQRQT